MLVVGLAFRDLLRERIFLVCNAAVLAGVLVPLLVLFGVKNGIYDALIGRLLNNPSTLLIETSGNSAFTEENVLEVQSWDQTEYVTAKTRQMFESVNVQRNGEMGISDAVLVSSGTGDPTLPAGLELDTWDVAIDSNLARQRQIAAGDSVRIFTQAEGRPRQLMLPLNVVVVLPDERAQGRSIFANIEVLELVEAFLDGYALPEHNITEGEDLSTRTPVFSGLRVFARDINELAELRSRIEQEFAIKTRSEVAQVSRVIALGDNFDLALQLTASVAGVGLASALIFGFWREVVRKEHTLAALALMGIGPNRLWIFPVTQAVLSGIAGLALSFALFFVASVVAERLFETGLVDNGNLVSLTFAQAATISGLVLAFVALTSYFAARRAAKVDPAEVLREGTT